MIIETKRQSEVAKQFFVFYVVLEAINCTQTRKNRLTFYNDAAYFIKFNLP